MTFIELPYYKRLFAKTLYATYVVGAVVQIGMKPRGVFLGRALFHPADLHLEPQTCVGGPHEGIKSVVFLPNACSLGA
jgi:hypothetical protein